LSTEHVPNINGSLSSLPSLESSVNVLSHDYDRLVSLKPTRPAPKLPPTYSSSNYSTINSYQGKLNKYKYINLRYLFYLFVIQLYSLGLEGIPFILNQNISSENKSIFKVIVLCILI